MHRAWSLCNWLLRCCLLYAASYTQACSWILSRLIFVSCHAANTTAAEFSVGAMSNKLYAISVRCVCPRCMVIDECVTTDYVHMTWLSLKHSNIKTRPYLRFVDSYCMVVWLSGNGSVLINVVAWRRSRVVLGWVTVCGQLKRTQLAIRVISVFTLRGTVKKDHISGWVIIINGDGGCRLWQPTRGLTAQVYGRRPLDAVLHSLNELGELRQWHCKMGAS